VFTFFASFYGSFYTNSASAYEKSSSSNE